MASIHWAGKNGDWSTKADWTGGVVPGAGDDVFFDGSSKFTATINSAEAAHSITISDASATVQDNAQLTLGAALSITGGTFQLDNNGTISGGTISASGGTFQVNGGTLDGVTYDGTLDMSAGGESLYVTSNGLTAKGSGGIGNGTINANGVGSDQLYFQDTQTLDNVTVNLGSKSGYDRLYEYDTTGKGGTLTLGSGATVNVTSSAGYYAEITDQGYKGDGVVNNGTINVTNANSSLLIDPTSFTNNGKINVANKGTVAFTGTISGAVLGGVANSGGFVELEGTVANAGGAITVGSGSALSIATLTSNGEITGGTIADTGSGLVFNGGTLDGVTYDGTLDMSAGGESLYVTSNGLTVKGAGGVGNGTINADGVGSDYLYFQDTQTLDNVTVNLGSKSGYDQLYEYDTTGKGGTLTLGSGATVNVTSSAGYYAEITDYGYKGDGVVNDGTINAASSGSILRIDPTSFTNNGKIVVSNGAAGTISAGTFANGAGASLSVAGKGSSLTIGGQWTNAGSIAVSAGGHLGLGGQFAFAQLGEVSDSGGSISFDGTLNNAGATLTVGTATTLGQVTLNGEISGGTIADAGSGLVFKSGTLDAVTYQGTLDMSAANSGLYVTSNGLTVQGAGGVGAGTINETGSNDILNFQDTQTLNNVTVNIGGKSADAYLQEYDTTGKGGTLTLGSGATVNVITGSGYLAEITDYGYKGDGVVNDGTINAASSGSILRIDPTSFTNNSKIVVSNGAAGTISAGTFANGAGASLNVAGKGSSLTIGGQWTNAGSIAVSAGGHLGLGGQFVTAQLAGISDSGGSVGIGGTLTNTGATLSVGTGSNLGQVTLNGEISGGTIADAGSGLVFNGGTLDGVTYQGTLDLSAGGESLYVTSNGLTAQGSGGVGNGTINETGSNDQLLLQDTQTLNNVTLNLGSKSGYAYLEEYDTTGKGGTLTLGSGATVNVTSSAGYYAEITDYGYKGDGVVNDGTINVTAAGASLTIDPTSFTNNGKINVTSGDSLTIDTATFSNAGAIGVAGGGTITFDGTLSTGALSGVSNAGGSIVIGGTLTNADLTLSVGTGSSLGQVTLDGTISGGIITDGGSGLLFSSSTLDGVTYDGTLTSSVNSPNIYVTQNGLVANGAGGSGKGAVNLGDDTDIYFEGAQTFDNATINLGDSNGPGHIHEYDTTGKGATLTFGAGLTINDTAAGAEILGSSSKGDSVVNNGAINASFKGGGFTISPLFLHEQRFAHRFQRKLAFRDADDARQHVERRADRRGVGGGRGLDFVALHIAQGNDRRRHHHPERRWVGLPGGEVARQPARHHRLDRHARGSRREKLVLHRRHDQRRPPSAGRRLVRAGVAGQHRHGEGVRHDRDHLLQQRPALGRRGQDDEPGWRDALQPVRLDPHRRNLRGRGRIDAAAGQQQPDRHPERHARPRRPRRHRAVAEHRNLAAGQPGSGPDLDRLGRDPGGAGRPRLHDQQHHRERRCAAAGRRDVQQRRTDQRGRIEPDRLRHGGLGLHRQWRGHRFRRRSRLHRDGRSVQRRPGRYGDRFRRRDGRVERRFEPDGRYHRSFRRRRGDAECQPSGQWRLE